MKSPIHLFTAIDDRYAQHCCVMLTSVLETNAASEFDVYLLTDGLSTENQKRLGRVFERCGNGRLHVRTVEDSAFRDLKLNIPHISRQTYYRYLLADLYPRLEKALYLDSDLVVRGDLSELWNTDLGDSLCAGVRDLWIDRIHYKPEIGFGLDELYVNAGVLLFNLAAIRREGAVAKMFDTTREMAGRIRFQDQDVINLVCRGRILELPERFNFATENVLQHADKRPEAVIVHYTGARKPWSDRRCHNPMKSLYFHYLSHTPYSGFRYRHLLRRLATTLTPSCLRKGASRRPIRVALIVDEFFGGAGTAYGGYGFLSRNYIAKYIPCDDIHIDVLIGRRHSMTSKVFHVDDVNLYQTPSRRYIPRWLKKRKYDLYLSIEMTWDLLCHEGKSHTPLLLWVQDPRPWSDWLEIQTVKLFPERCYWNTRIYENVHRLYTQGRVSFVTQGYFLMEKARLLYRLAGDTPIGYLPNPVEVDPGFDVANYPKKDIVIFVGRIASVKRAWLFCEIAKRVPECEFYLIGQSLLEKSRNDEIMEPYRTGIPNLHFTGHLEGEEKFRYIRDAKILVNTSIHEALPVSFLEALSCGTLLVSCQDPDGLTSRFGVYTGPVLGDGFDKVDLFAEGVRSLLADEPRRQALSIAAREYVQQVHGIEPFIRTTRRLIRETAALRRK